MKTFTLSILTIFVYLISLTSKAQTVVDVIVNSENHQTLETAVIAAGLTETLSGDGPFTVFAPTDDAFGSLYIGTVEALLEDPDGELKQILLYHALSGNTFSSDLTDGSNIETLQGSNLNITISGGNVYINGAMVTVADIETDNGVVHVIDAVLLPPAPAGPTTVVDVITGSEDHTTLAAAVGAAGLVGTLSGDGPFTVFAPTDDAFAALPEGTVEALLQDPEGELTQILLYHVVGASAMSSGLGDGQMIVTLQGETVEVRIDGGNVYINGAMVTVADIETDNGVVHVIDAVLLPPSTSSITEFGFAKELKAYPNPAEINVTVGFTIENESSVTKSIYDITGRKVYKSPQMNYNPGNHYIESNIEGLRTGIYFIEIESGGRRDVVRFIKN
jgi:uncharacterized surface protein with fasciclin (FAS1) repeats